MRIVFGAFRHQPVCRKECDSAADDDAYNTSQVDQADVWAPEVGRLREEDWADGRGRYDGCYETAVEKHHYPSARECEREPGREEVAGDVAFVHAAFEALDVSPGRLGGDPLAVGDVFFRLARGLCFGGGGSLSVGEIATSFENELRFAVEESLWDDEKF